MRGRGGCYCSWSWSRRAFVTPERTHEMRQRIWKWDNPGKISLPQSYIDQTKSTLCRYRGKAASLLWPQGAMRPHIPSRVLPQQVMPWAHASPTPLRLSVQSPAPPSTFPLPRNPHKHIPYKSSFPTNISHLTLTLQSALTPWDFPTSSSILWSFFSKNNQRFRLLHVTPKLICTISSQTPVGSSGKSFLSTATPTVLLWPFASALCQTSISLFLLSLSSVQELQSKLAQSFEILLIQEETAGQSCKCICTHKKQFPIEKTDLRRTLDKITPGNWSEFYFLQNPIKQINPGA